MSIQSRRRRGAERSFFSGLFGCGQSCAHDTVCLGPSGSSLQVSTVSGSYLFIWAQTHGPQSIEERVHCVRFVRSIVSAGQSSNCCRMTSQLTSTFVDACGGGKHSLSSRRGSMSVCLHWMLHKNPLTHTNMRYTMRRYLV